MSRDTVPLPVDLFVHYSSNIKLVYVGVSCFLSNIRRHTLNHQATANMKRARAAPVVVSAELASLNHTAKQNRQLPKLPANTIITRRPINHATVAAPSAGADVAKVVYISRKTPVMSAVKRVKKFLREIEKRALQSAGVNGILDKPISRRDVGGDEALQRKLGEVSERIARDAEEVLVKASGRAMEQALRIGEWFRKREEEVLTTVEVRTGSVSVVDDLVKTNGDGHGGEGEDESVSVGEDEDKENEGGATVLEGGDTTLELLRNLGRDEQRGGSNTAGQYAKSDGSNLGTQQGNDEEVMDDARQSLKKKKRKRKRREYDPDDLPEARIRWVKTVEVAISLRA